MVLSVLAMFFISTKVASESLEDTFMLDWYSASYSVRLSDSEYYSTHQFVTKELLDRYLEADLPPLYRYWHDELDDFYGCYVTYTAKNGKPVTQLRNDLLFPFGEFKAILAFDETQSFDALFSTVNMYMSALFAILLFSIIISYLFGREYNEHTLKTMLTVPISRGKFLISK